MGVFMIERKDNTETGGMTMVDVKTKRNFSVFGEDLEANVIEDASGIVTNVV